uniref:Transposase Tc1-like domain-containing protein n=1 Tax=Gouania willdenowi TaxID=441366 RepID=A0A8C5DUY4_GOUWI
EGKIMESLSKSSRNVAKDVGCSQSAVSRIWTKYKQHGKVVKGKHTGRPWKTSKHQDRKLKAIRHEKRKFPTKQMRNKWAETGVNVYDQTVRNHLKRMGFTYRKKRTRLQFHSKKGRTQQDPHEQAFSDSGKKKTPSFL